MLISLRFSVTYLACEFWPLTQGDCTPQGRRNKRRSGVQMNVRKIGDELIWDGYTYYQIDMNTSVYIDSHSVKWDVHHLVILHHNPMFCSTCFSILGVLQESLEQAPTILLNVSVMLYHNYYKYVQ